MKPDYKNWIPKGMLFSLIAGTVLSLVLLLVFGVFGIGVSGKLRVVLGVVFGIASVVCAKYTQWCVYAYRSFSYDGERKISKQIIDGTAEQITLRVLKKGGTYAIHDLMSPGRYGDMQAFVQKLRDMGYERVELMDTTDGSFMTPKEAKRLMLRGSTLLVGRK